MMAEGIRVVRGPDWNLGNKDGGEGHVGTVINDNGDDTVDVLWDMGESVKCRAGKDGKFDLRILDSAPAGVKHRSVICDGCKKSGITGVRWKCATCNDFDLCTLCYFRDTHNLQHQFLRIPVDGEKGATVPKRSISVRLRSLGTFPGATVQRGRNWEYGSQDGGSGSKGNVEDMRNYSSTGGERNAVKVKWNNGEQNVYKVGFRGKVDLKCVEEAPGTDYYRDHLPVLKGSGITNLQGSETSLEVPSSLKPVHSTTIAGTGSAAAAGAVAMPTRVTAQQSSFKVGDKVCVELPEIALKEAQRGHGGWSMRMAQCIGEAGIVKGFEPNGDVNIEIDGNTWRFFAGAVRKVPDVKVGDIVRVLDDADKVQAMQKRHGGWQSDMEVALGKAGKIVKIDSDGDVAVAFGQNAWVFNPGCLIPAPGSRPIFVADDDDDDASSTADDFEKPDTGDFSDPAADALGRLIAKLFVLETLGSMSADPEQLVSAAAKGDARKVQLLVKRVPGIINKPFRGLTALVIASHEGHLEVVKVLVQAGANKELPEGKGNTPLLAALMGKKEQVALYLIKNGANMAAVNINQRGTLHAAATNSANGILKILLDNGVDPNKQDQVGDTPLHDAIHTKNSTGTALLLSHPKTNLTLRNKKDQTPIHLAAMKDDDVAVTRMVAKSPSIVNVQKSDGYTPLHLAAVNNHTDVAQALIKGKALVDVTTKDKATPLHLAAHQAYIDMVKLLVENGADLKCVDGEGHTPLHYAMLGKRSQGGAELLGRMLGLSMTANRELSERVNTACLLIKLGASVQARDNRGRTPFEVCSNDRVRNAVRNFAAQNAPQTQRQVRRETLTDLFLEMPIPCMLCMQKVADARFLPCRHKVTCERCSFRPKECPMCDTPIHERVDLEGKRLVVVDPCKVQ